MPESRSAYSAFADLLATCEQPVSTAELHGLLVGRSCAGAGFAAEGWLQDAVELLGEPLPDTVRQALLGLQDMLRNELAGGEMALLVMLPDDEQPLLQRAQAMGQWCQGFLTGFGLTAGDRALSGEAVEVLEDLASIAQVEEALEESEDGESDFMEVMEYLRVAPLLLFAECAAPLAAENKPALH